MILSKEDIAELATDIGGELAYCGPLKVSCINGHKTETHLVSGWDKEKAKYMVEKMITDFLKKKNLS